MKVYVARTNEPYSGGCIIIAANTLEEAQAIAEKEMLYPDCAIVSELTDLQTTRTIPGIVVSETYFE